MPKVKTTKSSRGGRCPNPGCHKYYKTQRGVSVHLARSPICNAVLDPPEEYPRVATAHPPVAMVPDAEQHCDSETAQPGGIPDGESTLRHDSIHSQVDGHFPDEESPQFNTRAN